jgi:rod shape-determining protein MreD
MRWYKAALIFFFAFLIQTVVLWRFPIAGSSPNILLCLVVVFSFLYDERYGLVLGIIFGVLLDVSTSWFFGVQTVSFIIAYFAAAVLRSVFNHEKVIPDMLTALIATPVSAFLVWGAYRLAGGILYVRFVIESLPVLIISHCIIVAILHLLLVRSIIRHRRDRKYKSDYTF